LILIKGYNHLSQKAGLLTCNIPVVLPIRLLADSGHYRQKLWCVTYSCATVHDLHMVPFSISLSARCWWGRQVKTFCNRL